MDVMRYQLTCDACGSNKFVTCDNGTKCIGFFCNSNHYCSKCRESWKSESEQAVEVVFVYGSDEYGIEDLHMVLVENIVMSLVDWVGMFPNHIFFYATLSQDV